MIGTIHIGITRKEFYHSLKSACTFSLNTTTLMSLKQNNSKYSEYGVVRVQTLLNIVLKLLSDNVAWRSHGINFYAIEDKCVH